MKLFTDVIFPMTTQPVRPPAVAGMFYPDDPRELTAAVTHLLGEVSPQQRLLPKVLIAPHAGYVYSGGTAAHAYRLLQATRHIRRVILAGPGAPCIRRWHGFSIRGRFCHAAGQTAPGS